MASATRKSLVSRAGAAARKVVTSATPAAADGEAVAGSSPRTASSKSTAKKAPANGGKATKATTTAKTTEPSAKKPASKKSAASKVPAQKTTTAKAATTKKAAAKKSATTATAPAKTATAKKAPAKTATAKKAPATTATAKKAPAKKASSRSSTPPPAAPPSQLVVLEVEDPWTKQELAEVRSHLIDDVRRLTGELADVEGDLAGMIENSGEGAGNDQADVGSASFERDQEMVIVNNARDMLEQSRHAVERIADGSYGQCEICGQAIGKNRLMAFPRAELCLTCKQREERR